MALLFLLMSPAFSATSSDVKAAIDYMYCRIPSEHCVKPITRVRGIDVIVFVTDGWRYTMQRMDETPGYSMPENLSFWVRPDGTHGQDTLLTVTDMSLDGTVDIGVGRGCGTFELDAASGYLRGEIFQPCWQKAYDEIIGATLTYYRSPAATEPDP